MTAKLSANHQTAVLAMATGLIAGLFLLLFAGRAAAEPPRLFDPGYHTSTVDLAGLQRLRFLTSLDFPPFNFADTNRRPTGFNVDLARAICDQLQITDRCEIQAMPWDELETALEAGRGELILAGSTPSADLRTRFGLSEPYFLFPARFVGGKNWQTDGAPFSEALTDQRVAVVRNTAHETMLADWFGQADPVLVDDMPGAYAALTDGQADLIFGDGVTLSFWLASPASDGCCALVSGPYYSAQFLDRGMVAVTRPEDGLLLEAINGALKSVEDSGVLAEIHARYFPVDPFAMIESANP